MANAARRGAHREMAGEYDEIANMGCGNGFGVRLGAFGDRAVADENAGE
jgi:hypothetical protein